MTTPERGWADTRATIRLRRGAGGAVRVEGALCTAPVWARWQDDTLWLVGSGASPAGEDRIGVHVDVGPGVTVRVRSVAATVVYAARGAGTRWHTEVTVAEGACVDWAPEPVIVTARARHRATTSVRASLGSTVVLDDIVALGRAGEDVGAFASTLEVHVDGAPVLLTSFDTTTPGWVGPAGVDGAAVVAHRLRLRAADDPPPSRCAAPRSALLHPGAGCYVAVTAARHVGEARNTLQSLLPD